MANLNFPASPTIGQTYKEADSPLYTWNGVGWVIDLSGGSGTLEGLVEEAPIDAKRYARRDGEWVEIVFQAMPAGIIMPFGGDTAPEGYLMCYGQAVSRTTYALLFGVIGTKFGAGDGSTTFNLPDARGRVLGGVDNMGGSAANRITNTGAGNPGIAATVVGASGGVDRWTLGLTQTPSHNHGVNDPQHVHSVYDPSHAHSVYDPTHAHNQPYRDTTGNYGLQGGSSYYQGRIGQNTTDGINTDAAYTGIGIYGAYTGVALFHAFTGISLSAAGGGEPHPNVQPTLFVNYVISTGA